jgi:RNA polymerase primary sigma factor
LLLITSLSIFKLFLQEISQFPLLTPEEEIALGHRIKKGDKEAIEKMVVSNLRLVVKIARKYMGIGIPLIDLIQEGTLGLQFAAERFDVDLEFIRKC